MQDKAKKNEIVLTFYRGREILDQGPLLSKDDVQSRYQFARDMKADTVVVNVYTPEGKRSIRKFPLK